MVLYTLNLIFKLSCKRIYVHTQHGYMKSVCTLGTNFDTEQEERSRSGFRVSSLSLTHVSLSRDYTEDWVCTANKHACTKSKLNLIVKSPPGFTT